MNTNFVYLQPMRRYFMYKLYVLPKMITHLNRYSYITFTPPNSDVNWRELLLRVDG